jgi:hypothetical protein
MGYSLGKGMKKEMDGQYNKKKRPLAFFDVNK